MPREQGATSSRRMRERELLTAVNAVLRGEQFVGRRFAGHDFTGASDAGASESVRSNSVFAPLPAKHGDRPPPRGQGSILMMQVFWMTSRSSSGLHSRPGMRLSSSRPSHTGTAFFQDCRHMAWILLPRLSRADISRWMLLTRSRHS